MAEPKTAAGDHQSAFWRFSLAFYARPQVAEACLQLQDSSGVDVNLLLYLLFIAGKNRQVDRNDVARLDAIVKAWREQAVLPLRTLRRQLKTGIEPLAIADSEMLRRAVKRIELDAEHIEQDMLERLAPASALGTPATASSSAAAANLAAYSDFLQPLPGAPVNVLLEAFAQFGS